MSRQQAMHRLLKAQQHLRDIGIEVADLGKLRAAVRNNEPMDHLLQLCLRAQEDLDEAYRLEVEHSLSPVLPESMQTQVARWERTVSQSPPQRVDTSRDT